MCKYKEKLWDRARIRLKISDDSLILTTGNNYSVNTSASENLLGGIISKDGPHSAGPVPDICDQSQYQT